MADYGLTVVEFRGYQMGRGTVRRIKPGGLIGWEELPPSSRSKAPRFGLHGTAPSPVRFEGRTVIVAGFVEAAADRDALVQEWNRVMSPPADPSTVEPLTVTAAGRTLTVDVQLVAAAVTLTPQWGAGWFEWKAQWEASDPRRFAATWTRLVSPITTPTGGLTWPVTFPITFPDQPISGSVSAYNDGAAPAPAIYELTGPLVNPGVVLSTGRRVTYPITLADGQVLTIDTAVPGGWVDGANVSSDASSDLTSELELPPGVTGVQYLGTPLAGSPSLAVSFRPANW